MSYQCIFFGPATCTAKTSSKQPVKDPITSSTTKVSQSMQIFRGINWSRMYIFLGIIRSKMYKNRTLPPIEPLNQNNFTLTL